jgi:hypothetical protein
MLDSTSAILKMPFDNVHSVLMPVGFNNTRLERIQPFEGLVHSLNHNNSYQNNSGNNKEHNSTTTEYIDSPDIEPSNFDTEVGA